MTEEVTINAEMEELPPEEVIEEEVIEEEKPSIDLESVRSVIKEELDKWRREQQSLRDRYRHRINKEVEAKVEALKMAGITPTDEHIQAIQESVRKQVEEVVGEEEEMPQQTMQETPEYNPMMIMIQGLFDRYGTALEEHDPEVKLVNRDAADEAEYLASVKEAILAKKARLEKRRSSPAAAPGMTARGGNTADLTEKYKQEMLAARGQGYLVGKAIREKYRKLGVPVDQIGFTIIS